MQAIYLLAITVQVINQPTEFRKMEPSFHLDMKSKIIIWKLSSLPSFGHERIKFSV